MKKGIRLLCLLLALMLSVTAFISCAEADENEDDEDGLVFSQIILGIGIVLVTGVLGIAVFLGFRREDKDIDKKDDTSDN